MHVIFEPLDFIPRLAALAPKTHALLADWAVPKPRVNPCRLHGVFAPDSQHRIQVTPAKQGEGKRVNATDEPQERTPAEHHAAPDPGTQAQARVRY